MCAAFSWILLNLIPTSSGSFVAYSRIVPTFDQPEQGTRTRKQIDENESLKLTRAPCDYLDTIKYS